MSSFYDLLNDAIRTRTRAHPAWEHNSKLAGRRLAESLGVRVPELLAGPGPLESLTKPEGSFVVKPVNGHSSRGVLVLDPEGDKYRDRLTGAVHSWGRWRMIALTAKHLHSVTPEDQVRPPWIIEALIEPSMEFKCFTFRNGQVPLVLQRHAERGRIRFTWWDTRGDWTPVDVTDVETYTKPLPPPEDPDLIIGTAMKFAPYCHPMARIDLYEHAIFGEITPEPAAGHRRFVPEWDEILGACWEASL